MGHRPHVYVCRRALVDGGESPNQYVPQVTAEIRVYWPTYQVDRALYEFDKAVAEVRQQLEEKCRELKEWRDASGH